MSAKLLVYVSRWNGSSWETVGSTVGTETSSNPSLAITMDNTLYVTWEGEISGDRQIYGGDWQIYVRRWNGTDWEEVGVGSASGGGISNNSGESAEAAIAVAADGFVYVTWHDYSSGNPEIYVRQRQE